MDRRTAAVGTALFAVTVPATVAGLVPWLLAGRPTTSPTSAPVVARVVGAGLAVGGSLLVADAFRRFVGARGTPAPVTETASLVVEGPYRFSRNPQYLGVLSVTAGQALWWWSRPAAAYALVLAGSFHGFVRLYEEPRLRRRFPVEYARFTADVPRWLAHTGIRRGR